MNKRRKENDYRNTLAKYHVNMKDGLLKFLVDVAKAYEMLYPARFKFYLNSFRKLKQVRKASGRFIDEAGHTYFADQIPTEPFMFVQRWLPDFGKENEEDMELLFKAWEDFALKADKARFKRSTFWKGGSVYAPPPRRKKKTTETTDA
jgi:hypothetical protein